MKIDHRGLWIVLALIAGCDDDEGTILLDVDNISVSTLEDTPITGRVPVQANRSVTGRVVTPPSHGTLTTGNDGFFEYAPEANYSGPDTIALEFFAAGKTATGTVTITVTPVDDAPAAAADSFAAGFATSIDIAHSTLLANDTDIDSTSLTVSGVTAGSNGTVTMSGSNVTFQPAPSFQGVATFSYRVSDGTSSTEGNVTVTVGTNMPPVAANDTSTTNEDAPKTFTSATLLANDTDADQNTLSVSNVSNATNGTVSLAAGVVTFTPAPNFTGTATFEYVASDGAAGDTGTVAVQVLPIADPPAASADALFTAEDQMLTITGAALMENDNDPDGGTLQVTAVSSATNGSVALAGGSIAFTPAANFSGLAGFDYTVSDGTLTATAHVDVTVTPLNDAPNAVADVATGNEDVPVVLAQSALIGNDTDAEGDFLTFLTVANPTNGVVSVVASGVQFTAPANYSGPASFEYTVSDGTQSSTGTVTLTILPVNDAPTVAPDAATTNEDVAITLSPLGNDLDVEGDTITVVAVGTPGHGTATFSGTTVTYSPAANYFGPDSVTYTVGDAGGAMATATISITVVPVADAPTASADTFNVVEDTATQLDVLANDFDVDGETVSLVSAGTPLHGTTFVVGGQVQYTPVANYNGPDSFTYVIADSGGTQGTGTVSITVTPVNDAPVAVADFYTADFEATLTVPAATGLVSNDLDEGSMTVTLVSDADDGILVLADDGSFTYEPVGCVVEDTFTYQAIDASALVSAVTTVTIEINHGPFGQYNSYEVAQNTLLTTDNVCDNNNDSVLCNDVDVNSDPLTAALASPPQNAFFFTFQPDGTFSYQPNASFSGFDSFTYTVSDGVFTDVVYVDLYVYQVGGPLLSSASAQVGARAQSLMLDPDAAVGTAHGGKGGPQPTCCLRRQYEDGEGEGEPTLGYCLIISKDT